MKDYILLLIIYINIFAIMFYLAIILNIQIKLILHIKLF